MLLYVSSYKYMLFKINLKGSYLISREINKREIRKRTIDISFLNVRHFSYRFPQKQPVKRLR